MRPTGTMHAAHKTDNRNKRSLATLCSRAAVALMDAGGNVPRHSHDRERWIH
jgi:hypothetical protein